MKDRDFIYWLQGFFELAEPKEITTKQVACIHNHLDLVLANKEDEIEIPFIYWLEGIFDGQIRGGWDSRKMNVVIERLQRVFKHVIDKEPSEEQQVIFNNIHSQSGDQDGEVYRC